nr:hypothetical protein [Burkholderia ubonensis]
MLDLYYWTTPNGHKVTMLLEDAGLAAIRRSADGSTSSRSMNGADCPAP